MADTESRGSPAAPLQIGDRFAERYLIEAVLGRGGMGTVYRAFDDAVGETVALKTLDHYSSADASQVERFKREVRLARRVTHQNVARTYDLGAFGGRHFLTMEYIDGRSLRSWINEGLSVAASLDVAIQTAAGLSAAHQAGIVHRDLKPGNVMIDVHGRAVITDFGIARMTHEQTAAQTGGLLGTPAYMAPEQVEGRPADARTDLYALGLILIEMLSGERPFAGDNPFSLAMARLRVDTPDLSGLARLPEFLLETIERAVQREPDKRFASVAEFASALAKARHELGEVTAVWSTSGREHDEGAVTLDPHRTHTSVNGLPTSASTRSGTVAGPNTSAGSGPHTGPSTTGSATTANKLRALALLPFRYHGPSESEYVAEALLDELTDLLAMTRGLRVSGTGMTSRFTSVGNRDPRAIGQELGVEVVVDGTVQLAGSRLRVAARLFDVNGGYQLWNERFDGTLADVFELQDKLAKRIAEALRVKLEVLDYAELTDAEAVESYMRARRAQAKWRLRGTDGAIHYFRKVLERAPAFRPAIAGLAVACMRAWFVPVHGDSVDRAAEAADALERALAEAPEFPETHTAAATLAMHLGDYQQAVEHLRTALRIAPTCALAHEYLGRLQMEIGAVERATAHLELAAELDPSFRWSLSDIARSRAMHGDLDGYRSMMAPLIGDNDHRSTTFLVELRVSAWLRDRELIEAAIDRVSSSLDVEGIRPVYMFGRRLLAAYDPAGLAADLEQALALTEHRRTRTLLHQLAAEQAAFHEDYEGALEWLRKATDIVLVDVDWLDYCPLFEPLREDPRFLALRAEVKRRGEPITFAS
ncbi:MAG TPA: protein kinase [Enhygromyxa sp.]|nr:protein kinase [Enhygromyxa sp.]